MPVVRHPTQRRRSSLAINLTPIKAGNYGISSPSPAGVTFAPNVTPGTYVEPGQEDMLESFGESSSPTNAIFPPSEVPPPQPTRRRIPPGKRPSQGYIPRPANAFMLFRREFVRQKHVPGSIETNHCSLSKIIGNCWRALPLDEKRIWEVRAKEEKAAHQKKHPNYKYRPVHKKKKEKEEAAAKRNEKTPFAESEEQRCEDVAQLLLQGKKGDELAAAVRQLDMQRGVHMPPGVPDFPDSFLFGAGAGPSTPLHAPIPLYAHRRSSSVPPPSTLYNPITLPMLPFLPAPPVHGGSRPLTPVSNISRAQRAMLGQRRASSAQPVPSRSWMVPADAYAQHVPTEAWQLQRDWSPLPDVDTSLFEPTFLDSGASGAFAGAPMDGAQGGFKFADAQVPPELSLSISPFEQVPPHEHPSSVSTASPYTPGPFYAQPQPVDPLAGMALDGSWFSQSGPSSAFSGSPSPSESSLPAPPMQMPEPYSHQHQQHQQPIQQYDGWAQGLQDSEHAMHALGLDMCAQPAPALDMHMGFAPYEHAQGGMFSQGYMQDYTQEYSQELEDYAFQEAAAPQTELAY
ncbi:hypothetical protein CERSUDRAFT_118854 [Gelatoporia subvermispora B]|uniref:HMG box domain-containing protein n=1 Tax=Ceriporiopsis subvermispora (strain B) TaxID=914234 RepID=M2Q5W9_CERS8|nr:hypothetical protein CERSUDRAFT_118854 [Gelatoporia subvermispora B]